MGASVRTPPSLSVPISASLAQHFLCAWPQPCAWGAAKTIGPEHMARVRAWRGVPFCAAAPVCGWRSSAAPTFDLSFAAVSSRVEPGRQSLAIGVAYSIETNEFPPGDPALCIRTLPSFLLGGSAGPTSMIDAAAVAVAELLFTRVASVSARVCVSGSPVFESLRCYMRVRRQVDGSIPCYGDRVLIGSYITALYNCLRRFYRATATALRAVRVHLLRGGRRWAFPGVAVSSAVVTSVDATDISRSGRRKLQRSPCRKCKGNKRIVAEDTSARTVCVHIISPVCAPFH